METRVTLRRGSWERQAVVDAPAGPCRPEDIVPALHQLADAVVAGHRAAASCAAGCGTCCRQLVPVTLPEVGFLQRVVADQPRERHEQIRDAAERADDALVRRGFGAADGLCEHDEHGARILGARWFDLALPCPFLVEERCSIYAQRPLACREYLVTSPSAACTTPGRGLIHRVPRPISVWSRVVRSESGRLRWLPMNAALSANVPTGESVAGPELLARLLRATSE